jgi:hypothetical protein
MNHITFSAIGLIFDILGVLLLFKFGFPQPDFDEGVSLGLEDNTPITTDDGRTITAKEYGREAQKKKGLYKKMSLLALTLVLLGFTLQFIGSLQ